MSYKLEVWTEWNGMGITLRNQRRLALTRIVWLPTLMHFRLVLVALLLSRMHDSAGRALRTWNMSLVIGFLFKPNNDLFQAFLVSSLIFNGVCVKFHGWLDVQRLRGFGSLAFDEEAAQVEDNILRETLTRKHGSLEAASAAKALEHLYSASSETALRTSCIYDCRRRSRYSV